VVIAAGAHSGQLDVPGVPIPIRPVKGQLVALRGAVAPTRHNVRGIDGYIVSRSDGRVVVGATMEERGFDRTVTAEAVYQLLRAAFELVPGVLELSFEGAVAGLRPATPDNAPLIGRTQVEGLFLATGHFRNGILLVPITANAVARTLAGEDVGAIAPFSPDRFGSEGA
jgi:glycine oxidase